MLLYIDPFDLQTAGSRGAIPFPRSLLYHELVNVATQSVELAAGQKRRWDWAGLTTALVQATGGEVSNLFGGHSKGNLMAITFNTLAGNGARSLIDHTPFDPEAIFAQITGTFIGQEVGGKLFPNPEEQQRKKEEQEQYFNYQDYLRSQRERSPWNEVDDLADDISGSNPYGDNVADRWSYDFSKGGSTVDPHQNSTRPSSDWQHVGFAVFGHAPKSDPETAPEPTHVAKQNAHHQAVQVKSQITVAHQQDRHESSAVRASDMGVAHFLWQHQDDWWDKAILTVMHGFNHAMASHAGHVVMTTLNGGAALAENMNPLVVGAELVSGHNPATGTTVSRLSAFENFALDMAGYASDGIATVVTASSAKVVGSVAKDAEVYSALRGSVEELSATDLRSHILRNIAESAAARNSSFFEIHSYIELALFKLDVNTDIDTATFWSGDGNKELATDFAIRTDKTTIAMTPGGKHLELADLFKKYPYEQAIKPWDALSRRYAERASGNVYAFVEGARQAGVFYRIEYPTLIENTEIDEIIFSPSPSFLFKL